MPIILIWGVIISFVICEDIYRKQKNIKLNKKMLYDTIKKYEIIDKENLTYIRSLSAQRVSDHHQIIDVHRESLKNEI